MTIQLKSLRRERAGITATFFDTETERTSVSILSSECEKKNSFHFLSMLHDILSEGLRQLQRQETGDISDFEVGDRVVPKSAPLSSDVIVHAVNRKTSELFLSDEPKLARSSAEYQRAC